MFVDTSVFVAILAKEEDAPALVAKLAQLNLADCMSYACARTRGLPLLFKGDVFSKTDIVAA